MTVEIIEERANHRHVIVRAALIYTPVGVAFGAILSISVMSLFGGRLSASIPAVVLAAIVFALAFQAIAAIRDLRSTPTFTRGLVSRLWTKGNFLIFFRANYMQVGRQVFVISPANFLELVEDATVEVHHWPHSKSVIRIIVLTGADLNVAAEGEPAVELLPTGRTPYGVLGVPERATEREVAAGYRELSGASDRDAIEQQEIKEAYAILRDPERRRAYDGTGTRRRSR